MSGTVKSSAPDRVKVHTVYKTADGHRVPSVTTILGVLNKPALLDWAWKLGLEGKDYKAARDQAADGGTCGHYLIECHLRGETPDLSTFAPTVVDAGENAFLSYLEWEKHQTKFEPVLIEKALVSENHCYGGTIDLLARIDGELYLVDFKTGKAIYNEYFHQVAAYRALLHEHEYELAGARILRIGRTPDEGFEVRNATNLDKHWEIFQHCRALYELQKAVR